MFLVFSINFPAMPKNAKRSDFCEGNIFRDIKWPKIFNGGTAVRKCPNGTKGLLYFLCSLLNSIIDIEFQKILRISHGSSFTMLGGSCLLLHKTCHYRLR